MVLRHIYSENDVKCRAASDEEILYSPIFSKLKSLLTSSL